MGRVIQTTNGDELVSIDTNKTPEENAQKLYERQYTKINNGFFTLLTANELAKEKANKDVKMIKELCTKEEYPFIKEINRYISSIKIEEKVCYRKETKEEGELFMKALMSGLLPEILKEASNIKRKIDEQFLKDNDCDCNYFVTYKSDEDLITAKNKYNEYRKGFKKKYGY